MELNRAIEMIREFGTNGINYDVETEHIVDRLIDWSKKFEFEVTDVDHATVALKLHSLPEPLSDFCQEAYEFCPDIIDQGYACLGDMLDMAEAAGQEVDPVYVDLMNGLDPQADDFGLIVMERDLPKTMAMTLWWD